MRYSEYSLIQEAIKEIDKVIDDIEDTNESCWTSDERIDELVDKLDRIYYRSVDIKNILESFDYEESYYKRGL